MKLIYCRECRDIVRLAHHTRYCECGKSRGWYEEDGLHATIGGPCIPLGIHNGDFALARNNRRSSGPGFRFEAWVIPEKCDTVNEEDPNGE